MLHATFEPDLHAWMLRVYERRAGLMRERIERRVMQVLDSERRWLVPLAVGVVIGVAAVPLFGIVGLGASLGLLYVGAAVSGFSTMRRAERVERSIDPQLEAERAAAAAWQTRPELDVEARARLVRIMNLARASTLPGARQALVAEVREARSDPHLASWPFLADLDDLLRAQADALAG